MAGSAPMAPPADLSRLELLPDLVLGMVFAYLDPEDHLSLALTSWCMMQAANTTRAFSEIHRLVYPDSDLSILCLLYTSDAADD